MTTWRSKYLFTCLVLAIPATLSAQGPRGGFFPWWDSPMVNGLDLTDAQRTEIRSVIREYRGRMLEVRQAVQKAEGDLDAVFNEDTVDQRRGSEAIDRLTKARGEMTRSVSEMSLRMRAVLTPQQWQQMRQREREQRIENVGRGPGSLRAPGRGPRVSKSGPKELPPRTESQPPAAPPALNQQ